MKSIEIIALEGLPLIEPGDDLAALIVDAIKKNHARLTDGDVMVIAQKVFSKAENRIVKLKTVVPSQKACDLGKSLGRRPRFIELVLRETKRILKCCSNILLVEDYRGLVSINAGIDKSNIEGADNYALLPKNPDQSAIKFRENIKRLTGRVVGVVISDTYSRPFRRGQVNFAIGSAGVKFFRDYRGKRDIFGQPLMVKNIAIIDEIAAAAELLMGQAKERIPVVIVRGLEEATRSGISEFKDLTISSEEDLFCGAL